MNDSILLNLKILKTKLASTSAGLVLNEVFNFLKDDKTDTPYRDIINVYQQILSQHHLFEVKAQVKATLDIMLANTDYDDELISDCPAREILRKHYLSLAKKSYAKQKTALLLKSMLLSVPVTLPPDVTEFQLAAEFQSTLHFLLTTSSSEVFMYCDLVSNDLAELGGRDFSWRFED